MRASGMAGLDRMPDLKSMSTWDIMTTLSEISSGILRDETLFTRRSFVPSLSLFNLAVSLYAIKQDIARKARPTAG